MRVVLCLLTLVVACGAPEPALAPPSDLSSPSSAVAGANTMGSASIETVWVSDFIIVSSEFESSSLTLLDEKSRPL